MQCTEIGTTRQDVLPKAGKFPGHQLLKFFSFSYLPPPFVFSELTAGSTTGRMESNNMNYIDCIEFDACRPFEIPTSGNFSVRLFLIIRTPVYE